MKIQCNTRDLPLTRGAFVVMFGSRLLGAVREWMNGEIRLAEDGRNGLKMKDVLQYLAVLVCSHTMGPTIEKSIDLLRQFESVVP